MQNPPSGSWSQATFRRYLHCVLYVEVMKPSGDVGIGTAFHVGDGYLLTARHVVEDNQVKSIGWNGQAVAVSIDKVLYPADEDVDLALMRTDFGLRAYPKPTPDDEHLRASAPKSDHIEIGGHLDDWIGDELILEGIVVIGYPPVPRSNAPVLVAARGEINAIVDPYSGSRHPLFVISPMARGGFSGGPVLLPWGDLLGVVTESLLDDTARPTEVGFHSAVTVEPIWDLLFHHNVFPGRNAEGAYILRDAFGRSADTFGLSLERRRALDVQLGGS